MNDDHSPSDGHDADGQPHEVPLDEAVSAVLDGEATPAERARVASSPEGRRRLDELRTAAAAVAAPVPPLPGTTAGTLIARALDEAAPSTVDETGWAGASVVGADRVAVRRRQRDLGHLWRRVGGAAAAVAAVAVLVVGITALARTGGRSDSDTASSGAAATSSAADSAEMSDDSAGATSQDAPDPAAPTTEGYAAASGSAIPTDLGALVEAEAVLDRYAELLGVQPSIDHQFDESTTTADAGGDMGSTARTASECPVPPVAVAPGETWIVTATAQLPDGPVVVMGNGLGSPANRVLVVDATTCAVLAQRVI